MQQGRELHHLWWYLVQQSVEHRRHRDQHPVRRMAATRATTRSGDAKISQDGGKANTGQNDTGTVVQKQDTGKAESGKAIGGDAEANGGKANANGGSGGSATSTRPPAGTASGDTTGGSGGSTGGNSGWLLDPVAARSSPAPAVGAGPARTAWRRRPTARAPSSNAGGNAGNVRITAETGARRP